MQLEKRQSLYMEFIPFLQHFIKHPKLVFNFDYMEDFMMYDERLKQDASTCIYVSYRNVYDCFLGICQDYGKYFLMVDQQIDHSITRSEANKKFKDYQANHAPDQSIFEALLQHLIDSMMQELQEDA